MKRFALFAALALFFAQGVESSFVEAVKKEMEELRNDLVMKIIAGSSELEAVVGDVKAAQKGKMRGPNWDACEDFSDAMLEGEGIIAEAPQFAMEVVKNFTTEIQTLLQCVNLDPFKAFKCFIEQGKTLNELAADTRADAVDYGKRVTDCAAKIKTEFWSCVGKTTAAPTTAVPTTAAPKASQ